jgi:hypothetical protein
MICKAGGKTVRSERFEKCDSRSLGETLRENSLLRFIYVLVGGKAVNDAYDVTTNAYKARGRGSG